MMRFGAPDSSTASSWEFFLSSPYSRLTMVLMRNLLLCVLACLCSSNWALGATARPTAGARIKDIASFEGVRDNQLLGYGLVVGLNGTGDKRQTFFSAQSLANMLMRMGVQVSPTAMLVRNMAAVMVTATLPPYAQPGSKIDVQVAAIGDCTNLQGGLLVLSPLRAADGRVFAVAQGPVVTGGFAAGRGGGNTTTQNHPTAGRIPNGAIVETAAPSTLDGTTLKLQLNRADFITASRMARAINDRFGSELAHCDTAGSISVDVPQNWLRRKVEFVAELESIGVDQDRAQKIVIDEKTGTIISGKQIRVQPVAILHGNLSVEVQTTYNVSQPEALSQGKTVVTPDTTVTAKEDAAKSIQLKDGATVEDLVKALTAIGATPRDIIAIFQNLQAAHALDAEIEVI